MRRTTWIALLVVTAVLVAAAVFVLQRQASQLAAITHGEALFPELADRVNDVAGLEITTASARWTLERDAGGVWRHSGRGGYRADLDRVKQAVVALSRASVLAPKTADPARHDRLDLVAPTGEAPAGDDAPSTVRLVARDADGNSLAALILGKSRRRATTREPAQVYVRRDGEDRTWLVEGRFDIHPDQTEWLDKTLFKVTKEEVASIAVTRPDGSMTRIERSADGAFHLDAVPEGRTEQEFRLTAAGRALEFLRFRDVRPAGEVDMTGATTGVWRADDGLMVTVRTAPAGFKTDGEDAFWVTFEAGVDADRAATATGTEGAAARAATASGIVAGWAYLFPRFSAENFMPSPDTLTRPKEES